MGHIRLGHLHRSKRWIQVVELLDKGAPSSTIAKSSLEAADAGFKKATSDPTFHYVFWLLTQLPLAAKSDNFQKSLKRLQIPTPNNPTLPDVVAAFTERVDQYNQEIGHRSDIGEMAQLAAAESLTKLVSEKLPGLFEADSKDVQSSFRDLNKSTQFALLGREFFARFTQRYLTYYLSRELSNHVGIGRRFTNIRDHSEFLVAFQVHCREASRIVQDFAGGWFGKHTFRGGIDLYKSKRFIAIALKKIRAELQKRGA